MHRTPGPAQTTLSDVADSLGITRRPSTATSPPPKTCSCRGGCRARRFRRADRAIATDFDDVTGHLVEVVAYIIERLPEEPLLTLLLENDRTNQFSRRMLQPVVIARCRIILQHTRIDWAALGYGEHDIDELVEFLLRIIQSMVIAPTGSAAHQRPIAGLSTPLDRARAQRAWR